jgi:hypothetical protein
MSSCIKNLDRSQVNSQMMYLKVLDKQKQVKSQISKWKEIMKIREKLVKWRLEKK